MESIMGFSLVRRYFTLQGVVLCVSGLCAGVVAAAVLSGSTPTVLIVGDSLSAEYGLKRGMGWVALLEQRMAQEKVRAKVINASISGDTTAGGHSRLGSLLARHRPAVVVIELGGNDALRGLPLQMTQGYLQAMTQEAQTSGAKVLLLGMQMPPNYGQDYAKKFAAMYLEVARANKVALVPFLLKGVADGPNAMRMFQADRIHPTEEAHPMILGNVWPTLKKLIA
jgi:acyl-CoA thioesterase-1